MKALTTWNLLMNELHTLEHETESVPPVEPARSIPQKRRSVLNKLEPGHQAHLY